MTHAGIKVNLLDTPGYADFIGDLRAGLRAADAALFAVSAADGVDGLTRMLWDECAAVGMPRAVVITKIDHQRGDFDEALAICRDAFGDGVAPLYLPVAADEARPRGLIGLLSQRFYDYSSGSAPSAIPSPSTPTGSRNCAATLIEGIIQESEDETLMDRYLAGEEIDAKVLIEDLEKAVARGSFYPVLAASAAARDRPGRVARGHDAGVPLAAASTRCPPVTTLDGTPVSGLSCDPKGPLLAEVVKTTSDPYVGRISLVRVFSGTLRPGRRACMFPGTGWPSAATRTTTPTSGSAP